MAAGLLKVEPTRAHKSTSVCVLCSSLLRLLWTVSLVGILSGCSLLLNPTSIQKSNSWASPRIASPERVQSLGESGCVQDVVGSERTALLEQALADSQLLAVQSQLEQRGLSMTAARAITLRLAGTQELVLIPFGQEAHLLWRQSGDSTSALAALRQGQKTLNLFATGEEHWLRPLRGTQLQKLLRQLRGKSQFQGFEQQLQQQGRKLDASRLRAAIDETRGRVLIGLALVGETGEALAYALRLGVQLQGEQDFALVGDAEPQATACLPAQSVQATDLDFPGSVSAQTHYNSESAYYDDGSLCGEFEDPYQVYQCVQYTVPLLYVNPTSLDFGQIAINQSKDLSFTVSNTRGGTLTGTVSGSGICTIVSGGSFSLVGGASQTVVVRCQPTATGSFSVALTVSSNSSNKTVTASGTGAVGPKLQLTPTSLDFGNVAVGGTKDLSFTVKNIGDMTLTGSVSAPAPYNVVSGGSLNLAAGASQMVTLRFSPTVTGSVSQSVSVSSTGGNGSVSVAGTGVEVKLEVSPTSLDFGVTWAEGTWKKTLTVKNLSAVTVSGSVSASAPFGVASGSSFSLDPQQSQEVVVSFSPTATNSYAGTVSA